MYVSSSEATAPHNGTKTLSITIKWVCVRGVEGKGIRDSWGRSLCVLNVQGDAKTQCGTLKAKGRGGLGLWDTEGWGCAAFGKMRIRVPRAEWKTCLLIE